MKDFNDMTGPELVEAYNAMATSVPNVRTVNRFENLVTGIHRCQLLQQQIKALKDSDIPEELRRYEPYVDPEPSTIATPEAAPKTSDAVEADRRWRNWQPSPEAMTRPRKAVFEKQVREERMAAAKEKAVSALSSPTPSLPNASRCKRADRVIRLLVAANPRRPGTEAHKYFEAMKGGATVGEYLAKFPEAEHRKAAQWLWNTCRDNFAKLLG